MNTRVHTGDELVSLTLGEPAPGGSLPATESLEGSRLRLHLPFVLAQVQEGS